MEKPKTGSFVFNCLIKRREYDDSILFEELGDNIIVRLDNYAIVPREEYESLLQLSA